MIIEDLGDTCLVEHVQYGQWQVTHHHHQPQVALNEVAVILEAPAQAPVETINQIRTGQDSAATWQLRMPTNK